MTLKAESTDLCREKYMKRERHGQKRIKLECNNQIRLDSFRFSKQFFLSPASLEKDLLVVLAKPCLVPRPQYYASVIRFGSRGPERKVWSRQKSGK